jgi:hypothetical protein
MKYLCFGYYDEGKSDGMTEGEQNAMFDTWEKALDTKQAVTAFSQSL